MLNTFAKLLLVSTSLSPLLGAVAITQFAKGEPAARYGPWLAAALLLVLLCWALLRYMGANGQKQAFRIKEFERNDTEVLAFLVTYLLPILSTDKMGFSGEWLTGAYVLAVIFLVVSHAGAFHFNPVMGLLGFHFYAAKSEEGVSNLLISRSELRRPGQEIQTVRLAHHIFLQTESENAA